VDHFLYLILKLTDHSRVLFSNLIGEIGQQIDRTWGDKMWATRILDKIVQINEQNLPIVINWMQEYGHTMNVIIVENDEYAGDLLKLFYHLAMSEVGDFLDMVNTIISMIFSNDLDPPVTKVTNKNIYIVVFWGTRLKIV